MRMTLGRWLCAALLAAGCFALSNLRGEAPTKWNGSSSDDEFIVSILERDDAIFASTNVGLYRAALSDKIWRKLPLPASAPLGGELAREAAPSPVLVYYTRHFNFEPFPDRARASAMYLSTDSGQTWEHSGMDHDFTNVFVQSGGDLFACERMQTPDLPPHPDKDFETWATDDKGQKLHIWYRLLLSHDLGKTWRDLSEGLSSACSYACFPDFNHPKLVRLIGAPEADQKRIRHYEADDQTYHWKEIPWQDWHSDPGKQEDGFGPSAGGSNDDETYADLSTLLKYPFLKWGNGLSLHAIQIEAEKSAYTFRQHEPMPVALKAFFVFTREPLQFADNEDETICWSLWGYLDNGEFFRTPAKANALSVGTPDDDVKLAAYRDNPGGRIVTLDDDHPYQRTIDLAKLYQFPGPGKYRIQPHKTLCPFFKGDASFAGQVIDVTITP